MRKTLWSFAGFAMLTLSTTAVADVAQAWQCQLVEGKTNDELMTLANSWLDAAKGIDDRASVRIYFPVATEAEEGSFIFIFYLPDFESWGKFNDAYPGSPVAQVDAAWNEIAPCKVPALWDTADLE